MQVVVCLLALHGYGQNGWEFFNRYKPLLERKLKALRVCCPTAPLSIQQAMVNHESFAIMGTWWHPRASSGDADAFDVFETATQEYCGWEEVSKAGLLELWKREGPFEGLLGFSQGAVAVHQLLLEGVLSPPPSWVILASGFPSRAFAQGTPLTIPSMHLFLQSSINLRME